MAPSDDLRAELDRRKSNTAIVLEIFRAKPKAWISWGVFADAVGERAYRTRISNAKKILVAEGGTVESRTYPEGVCIITEYRYLPHVPLGRPADVPVPDQWPAFEAPIQETFRLTPPETR